MKRFTTFFLFALPAFAAAQQPRDTTKIATQEPRVHKDTRPWSERVRFGGATGFWINTKQTHVDVSVLMAYNFPKILTTGVGYRYIYTRNRIYGKDLNSYGPNIFARAGLTRRIYLWSEWEYLNTEYVAQVAGNQIGTEKTSVQSFFGGIGYIRQIGKRGRGGLSLQVLYNFLYDQEDNSPYWSPVTYRVGYFF